MTIYIKWKDKFHSTNKIERWEKISEGRAKKMIFSSLPKEQAKLEWAFFLSGWINSLDTNRYIISSNRGSNEE